MTIKYSHNVGGVSKFGSFGKVITTYKGSVYKLIKFDLVIYLILYGSISALYRFTMTSNINIYFEYFVVYCKKNVGRIPLTFVLVFYMHIVVQRWWETYKSIPWPDSLALKLSILFPNYVGRELECMNMN